MFFWGFLELGRTRRRKQNVHKFGPFTALSEQNRPKFGRIFFRRTFYSALLSCAAEQSASWQPSRRATLRGGCSPEISWSRAVLSCITKGWGGGGGGGVIRPKNPGKKDKEMMEICMLMTQLREAQHVSLCRFLFLFIALIVVLWACDDSTTWREYRRWRKNSYMSSQISVQKPTVL
jgi:hypothetical protein